jgi:hypothetical protein
VIGVWGGVEKSRIVFPLRKSFRYRLHYHLMSLSLFQCFGAISRTGLGQPRPTHKRETCRFAHIVSFVVLISNSSIFSVNDGICVILAVHTVQWLTFVSSVMNFRAP